MLALLLAVARAADPCPELPLAPGTSWTYRAVAAWAPAGDTTVRHGSLVWRTVVLERRQADSILVATVRGWPSELAWWTPGQVAESSIIVCVASRVYHLTPDSTQLRAVADSLLRGQRRPSQDDLILQFPLRAGMLFGRDSLERRDRMYAWDVTEARAVPAAMARWARGPGDSLFTLTYLTLPDHQIIEFVPRIGIVDYVYGHHGTVAEAHAWLTGFRPGRTP